MRKSYEAHENEYKRMKSKGIKSWERRNYPWSIFPPDRHFIENVFMLKWAPKKTRAIELGCGTGTISRWLAKKGFTVTGIDISKTAIQMAKAQSKTFKIKYINKDFCSTNVKSLGKYNLCIDGHFMHCITDKKDRKIALNKIRQILNPSGILVFMSMCSPISRKNLLKTYSSQRILGNIIYIDAKIYGKFEGSRVIGGKEYIPMRYIAHWKSLLSELRQAGFSPMITEYFKYDKNNPEEPTGLLNVAAIRK